MKLGSESELESAVKKLAAALEMEPAYLEAVALSGMFGAGNITAETAAERIASHNDNCHCPICASLRYSQRNASRIPDKRRPDFSRGAEKHTPPTGAWADFLEGK